MDNFTQSPSATEAAPGKCEHCGATIQLSDGICVSCFLKEGLKTECLGSAETFESVLAEADVPDLEWRLGNYKIVKEIGRGGMGAVYLAERADEQYEKRVAIKLIKRGMDTELVLRHFRTERQILAGFDHPNIARLFDGGMTENGLPYFIMEYVDGLPIDEYCNAHALSIPERLRLFREVCAAVSYAHRHLVIHRDLKRSNILVTSEGVPKLLDFGIAKILQQGDTAEPLATVTGLRLMTPEYASPEQVRGESVTTATDVYSLGVVLYEMLTGNSPYQFPSQSPYDVARVITEKEPSKPSTSVASRDGNPKSEFREIQNPKSEIRNPGNPQSAIRNPKLLRGDLDNIILMALRKEPERRYASVDGFSDDIRRHLEDRPVLARGDTISYRTGKFIRRNRVTTAAGVLVLMSLLAGVIATTWQAQRAKAAKARAERRFNDVRQLAHSVLFDYHDAIKDLPGATRVRERLVKDALAYLDNLAREAAGDPDLQRELATAYERVGDVRGRASSASLGDVTGAVESYLKAIQIREAIVAAGQKDLQSRRDLARSYIRIGIPLLSINEADRGMDYLRKALATYLELDAKHPGDLEIRYGLAAAYNEVGFALEDYWGNPSEALENHRKALSLREEFVAADSSNQAHRRDLSDTYVNIGRALVMSGDTKGGLDSNQKGLAIRIALFSENPSNADYRRRLAISYQNDGKYRELLHDVSGALESFRQKMSLDEKSLSEDPINAQTQEDLGYSYEKMGDLLAESGDYTQALSYYTKALAMYEKVLVVAPEILRVHYRLIFAHAGIAKMQAKLGDRNEALAACSKANVLLNEVSVDPNLSWQAEMRGQLYTTLANAFAALAVSSRIKAEEAINHWRSARENYQRSLDIYLDMNRRGAPMDQDASDRLTAEIAKCEAALRR